MAHYVKLFESIIHSTLWSNEPASTRVVWVTMLAMADSEGEVQASIPGLAKAAGVSLEECQSALQCFLSPDPFSRSKESEGRRIQEIRGGWELINYKYYRSLKSREQEKENAAERQHRARERKKAVTVVTNSHAKSLHIEEEEDVEEEEGKKEKPPSKRKACLSGDDLAWFEKAWENWPSVNKKDGSAVPVSSKAETMKRFQKILKADSIPAEVLAYACGLYYMDRESDGIYLKAMQTFLGPQRAWADYIERAKAVASKRHAQEEVSA